MPYGPTSPWTPSKRRSAKSLRVRVTCAAVLLVAWTFDVQAEDAGANATMAPLPSSPLRVVVAGSAPFVEQAEERPTGLSVEVFEAAASNTGAKYRFVGKRSVPEALDAVASGQADVAVGPISITAERATQVQFTQPYFHASLAIIAPAKDSLLAKLRPFLTTTFLAGSGALILVLLGVGTALWLAERKGNPEQFPGRPIPGIGNGVWMALVTMTTVGYGDRVPLTLSGRIVTGVWMLTSMIVASSLTAFIATALTLSQIDGPQLSDITELRNRRVAVVSGTTGERLARKNGADVQAVETLSRAIEHVETGKAAAAVFDRPMLRYWLAQHPESQLQLSPASYAPQAYGFAVARDASPLRDRLDVALLRLRANGRIEAIDDRWLGESR